MTNKNEPQIVQCVNNENPRQNELILIIISLFTIVFICIELVGAYFSNSLAILTDAFHMTSDLLGFIISIFAIHCAKIKPSAKYSFGFQRSEVIGAFISILLIWVLTAVLVYLAIIRIVQSKYNVYPELMTITSAAGVIFNIIIAIILFLAQKGTKFNHSHFGFSHSDSSHVIKSPSSQFTNNQYLTSNNSIASVSYQSNRPLKRTNINIRAAFAHVVGDLIQSIGVLVSSIIINFTGFQLADPICTFLFSILVLITTIPLINDILLILMEGSPNDVNLQDILLNLKAFPGIIGVHGVNFWTLKPGITTISLHLELSDYTQTNKSNIVSGVYNMLYNTYHIHFITIQTYCPTMCFKEKSLTNV